MVPSPLSSPNCFFRLMGREESLPITIYVPSSLRLASLQISFDGDTDTDDGEVADALFIRVAAIFSDIHIVISGLSDFL